jgi:hypothetical protein
MGPLSLWHMVRYYLNNRIYLMMASIKKGDLYEKKVCFANIVIASSFDGGG